jgi:hypothetical protein
MPVPPTERLAAAANASGRPAGQGRLASGGWEWWPDVVVRGAGFPAAGVRRLAAAELAKAADAEGAGLPHPTSEAYQAAFATSIAAIRQEIRTICQDEPFRRAVTWQNHRVIATAIDPLLRRSPANSIRNSKERQHEELVAAYWHRYCVKNDSIGFFGPVGWGRLDDATSATTSEPGPTVASHCTVYFEAWAIDRLAEVIGADPAIRPWVRPRPNVFVRLDGTVVRTANGDAVSVSDVEATVLGLARGRLNALQIAAMAGLEVEQVVSVLDSLAKRRVLSWRLDVPLSPYPERELQRLLETIEDPQIRTAALRPLIQLEGLRNEVRAASSNGTELAASLKRLDDGFEAVTGGPSRRNAGKTYAGRTLVYLDCRRDLRFVAGRDLIDALLPPLGLVASSVRWFCYEVSRHVNHVLRRSYDEVVRMHRGPVDLATFWFAALPALTSARGSILADVRQGFQDRWTEILAISPEVGRIAWASDDLAPRCASAFAAPRPGWMGARTCSPDVMIAAKDVGAIRDGEFVLVLGEMHQAINTLGQNCFVLQHPSPDSLLSNLDRNHPMPRLLPVLPKEAEPRLSVRTQSGLTRRRDIRLAYAHFTLDPTLDRYVTGGETNVELIDGRVRVRVPGGESFEAIEVFGDLLTDWVINECRFGSEIGHVPRTQIDRLVIMRETWRFDAASLPFATEADEATRFAMARRWKATEGIPNAVFVSTGPDEKPIFVDFESPLAVNLLAKAIRRERSDSRTPSLVQVSEMYPALDDLWLRDADGVAYTAELRLAGFDVMDGTADVRPIGAE